MNQTTKIVAALLIGGLFSAPTLGAQQAVTSPNPLQFEISGHDFIVSGGSPGDTCGIALGLQTAQIPLANGSMVLIVPLAIVAMGEFDAQGQYTVTIGWDAKMLCPLEYHFQAFSVEGDSLNLVTSNRATLDFRGLPPCDHDHDGDEDETGDKDDNKAEGDVDGTQEGDR